MSLSIKDISMKNIHGKIFLLLLLAFSLSHAEENRYCSYNLISSKYKNIVLNEPIKISFFTRQKLHNEVMFFDLIAKSSDAYEIISINEKRHEYNYHDAQKEFEFLLIPKKSGKIKVNFNFNIRRASDDAVAVAYVGSRDNVKSIPTVKVHIASPSLTLNVKQLSTDVDAIGNFSFSMKLDKRSSNSYDAINVVYTLEGRGILDEKFEPIQEIKDISIFRGIKESKPRATKNGYIYKKEWSYALIGAKSFTLPSVTLSTYNYKTQQFIKRQIEEKNIKITALNINNLLDDRDAPQTVIDYKEYINYLYNILIFIAGFVLAKLLNFIPKKATKREECCKLISAAKTPKELLNASLRFAKDVDLKEEINSLELIVYERKTSKNIAALKAAIIKKINKS